MIKKLKFDEKYTKAFKQVFGKALICPSLEIASNYARSKGFNAVTLDGDRADRKGALTGGYHDTKRCRLEVAKTLKKWSARLAEETAKFDGIKKQVLKIEQEITKIRDRLTQIDAFKQKYANFKDNIQIEISSLAKEEERLKETVAHREQSLEGVNADIRKLELQIDSFSQELKTAFVKKLTAQEEKHLDQLKQDFSDASKKLAEVAEERAKMQSRKSILEIELGSNLRRRIDECKEKLESFTGETGATGQLDGNRQELETLSQRLNDLDRRYEELDVEIEQVSANITNTTQHVDQLKAAQTKDEAKLHQYSLSIEKYVSKKALLQRKRDECIKNIRELGVLPEEAFEKYIDEDGNEVCLVLKEKVQLIV